MLNNLNEVLDRLSGLDEKSKTELVDLAYKKTEKLCWLPNPGPQTAAFFSEADEIFYGGQAGGGKSDLEVGLALTAHTNSLLLRRTNREANGLVERIADILGTRDGWSSQVGVWRYGKRNIEIGGCQLEEDKQKFKGKPRDLYCLGEDTPILMANGGYKPIQDVVIGDMVATLGAPCRVTKAWRVYDRESVELSVTSHEGVTTKQVQSANHRVLTQSGWVSPCTPTGGQSSPSSLGTMLNYFLEPFFATILNRYELASLVLRKTYSLAQSTLQLLKAALEFRLLKGLRGMTVSRAELNRRNDFLVSDDVPRYVLRIQKYLHILLAPLQPLKELASCSPLHSVSAGDASHGRYGSSPRDLIMRCLTYFHLRGGRIPYSAPLVLKGDQSTAPLLVDAAQPRRIDSLGGETDKTPKCNQKLEKYPHPYKKDTCLSQLPLIACKSYSVTPVGKKDLYDLEVEGLNHFITKCGVSSNCFDEVSDFTETQYTFIIGWNRSVDPKQRCRIIAAGNPPTQPEGFWVLKRWAAWLDPTHPNPALPGELRWYTTDESGDDIEVDGRGPHMIGGEEVYARSRTFIPAKLSDNPELAATDYAATLAALPEPYRSAYRDGNFMAAVADNAAQTIPTSWVREAQRRWKSVPPLGVPMCGIGVDVAQGGSDNTVLAIRHDGWYAPLIKIPGNETPDGKTVAGKVVQYRRDSAVVAVDLGGGWGGDAYGHLKENSIDSVGYMGVKSSTKRTVDKQIKFTNVRSEAYWRFREALDPSQEQGSPIALPEDPELVADLCAPTFSIGPNGIAVEAKVALVKRLGRSPDKGDAVIMAWWVGPKQANIEGGWKGRKTTPKINLGRVGNRRR